MNRASLLNILDASGSFKFSKGFTRQSANSPPQGSP
jgi:hypothetical protein